MVDKEIIEKKLNLLEETLAELEELKGLSYESLSSSIQNLWVVEHDYNWLYRRFSI